jgi:hypothetical protein
MAKKEVKNGRPSEFTQKIADSVCFEIATGKSLRTVCKGEEMPAISTVFNWFSKYPKFVEQYARACQERTEAHMEQLLDFGDEALLEARSADPKASGAVVQAVRLKADNLKWAMSKMKPKKYGDKVDVTSDGKAIKGNTIMFGNFKEDE